MLLIAHRGASALASENSVDAFTIALGSGADGIETDVRLTADGVAVLSHDDDLARSTRRPLAISQTLRAQLPPTLPTLADLLDIAGGKIPLYLELKIWIDHSGFHSASLVAEAIAEMVGHVPQLTISSFDPAAVSAARALIPTAATALGVLQGVDPSWAIEAAVTAGHQEVHAHEEAIDADLVGRTRASGLRLLGFTVNDPSRIRELAALGVDGIFTDDPGAARAALSE